MSESRSVLRRLSIQAPEKLVARIEELERHQAEDQAAIRDMADVMVLFLHPGEPDCPACVVAKKHDATIKRAQAIQRAREQEGK